MLNFLSVRYILSHLFFYTATLSIFAQTNDNDKAEWQRHYKGKLDGFNDVALTLALNKNGQTCTGQLTFLRSKEVFAVEGSLLNNQLTLAELYGEDKLRTGELKAVLSDNALHGRWYNATRKVSAVLVMEETTDEPDFPSYCGDGKWLRRYEGKKDKQPLELTLQKMEGSNITGVAYFPTEGKNNDIIGQVEMLGKEEGTCNIEFVETHEKATGKFVRHGKTLELQFGGQVVQLDLAQEMVIGCVEYSDFFSKYDFLYPKTDSKHLNEYLESILKPWQTECQTIADSLRHEHQDAIYPNLRTMARSNGWYEIIFWSDKLINGLMFYSNSYTNHSENVCFNFDLENKKEISLSSLFLKKYDYERFIKEYILEIIKKNELYQNKRFQTWVQQETFNCFALLPDGIRFFSNRHALFGTQSVLVPYEQLSPFMVKNSPLPNLFGASLSGFNVQPKKRKLGIFLRKNGR